jgi:rhodanese-related sulfurtransferase
MKELNKTNRLTIVVVAIVLVFVTGILTLQKPDLKYSFTPAQSLEMLGDSSGYLTSGKALAIIAANDGKTVLIDVRNSIAFDRGHVKDARNIPVRELFSKQSLSFLKEVEKGQQTILLYGETPRQANGPWIMLRQLGFKNVAFINSTFGQISSAENDTIAKNPSLLNEVPLIDTAALKKLSASSSPSEKTVENPVPVKKTVKPAKVEPASGGGC